MQDSNHTMWAHLVDGLQRSSEDGLLLFRAWCLPSAINENNAQTLTAIGTSSWNMQSMMQRCGTPTRYRGS